MRRTLGLVRRYLAGLSAPRTVLWCYLIWWAVVVVNHFDPSVRLWLTSLGLSVIIGVGLIMNARSGGAGATAFWPSFRFFMAPFCVSSFSALVKNQGFTLVFSPQPVEVGEGLAACGALLLGRWAARRTHWSA